MRKIKAAELTLDFTLYPRNNVDSQHVTSLANALAAGSKLPAVVICKKSKRVADGVHRVKAHLQFLGKDAEIECIEKTYKTDADFFADAMRFNAIHGAKLDPCDRAHCIIIGEKLGLSISQIAGALNVPAERLGALKVDRLATSGGLSVALKRTVRHFAGQDLSVRQTEANKKLSGMNQVFYVNQVIELIESDMLDKDDDDLIVRLRVLNDLLEGVLAA